MNNSPILGRVHSIQTLGTLDGPGVRFVVFAQGCPLRCGCCHNPDTWDSTGGIPLSSDELLQKALRYREYFGSRGGVTLSGGEPLLQAKFGAAFFKACKKSGLNTCLDTSGALFDESVKELLSYTDRVLLDIKYPTEELYLEHVGCHLSAPLRFLNELESEGIPTTLRQVTIPSLNDTKESAEFLAYLQQTHRVVDRIELLPFRKICTVKYERLGIPFCFDYIPEPSDEDMARMNAYLKTAQETEN